MRFSFDLVTKPTNTLIFEQENPGCTLYIEDNKLWIAGDNLTEKQAADMLAAHNPPQPTEPTFAEKLASVGLSIDDLKAALGL
jgi:hypothetical protein